jgi:hypothetical protein
MFDKFGRVEGFGQIAPGRDLPPMQEKRPFQPQQGPNIGAAIRGGATPQGTFNGAAQTLGGGVAKGMGQAAGAISGLFGGNKSINNAITGGLNQPQMTQGMTAPPQPKLDPNDKRSGQQFLTDELNAWLPELRKVTGQSDEVRKNMAQEFLNSKVADLRARGVDVLEVKGEKIRTPQGWIDVIQDIADGRGGGAANAQWLVEDPNAPAAGNPMQPAVPGTMAPTATGDGTDWRQMIMQALAVDPRIAAMGKQFGY